MSGMMLGGDLRASSGSSRGEGGAEKGAGELCYLPTRLLWEVRMLGTDEAYGTVIGEGGDLKEACVGLEMSGVTDEVSYRPTRLLCAARYWCSVWAIGLRACCYAMPGTDARMVLPGSDG
eukprot:1118500-Rhodomonas_salina.2